MHTHRYKAKDTDTYAQSLRIQNAVAVL